MSRPSSRYSRHSASFLSRLSCKLMVNAASNQELTGQWIPCFSHTVHRGLRCGWHLPLYPELYPRWLYVFRPYRDIMLTSSGDPHPSPLLYHFGLSLPSLRPSLPIPFLTTISSRQSQRQSTLRRGHSELGVNHDGHQGLVGRD